MPWMPWDFGVTDPVQLEMLNVVIDPLQDVEAML